MNTRFDEKPRILLVDDDPDNIKVLALALEDEYALSFATSGKTSLQVARSEPKPDMLLVDVMMPDMDGFQVCTELNADPSTADIPVIFVTALDDRINEERGFQAGAVDYITKPISVPVVGARVRTHLALKQHRAFLERLLERRAGDLQAAQHEVREILRSLRESEESFRNLIEGSIQGIVIQRDWKPLFANQAFADILGFASPREILALDSLEPTFSPHERARLRAYQNARSRGDHAPAHYEFDALRKDGSALTLQCTVSLISWKGKPAHQVAVIDITERKRTEEALRTSEARFRAFFDNSPDAMSIQDPDGRYLLDNRQSDALYGHTSMDTRGKLPHEVWPPDIAANVKAANRRVREYREPVEYENEVLVEGEWKYVCVTKFPIIDAEEQLLGIGSVGSEVTLRKRAENELRHSRRRFRDFAEASSDWFWEMGADLRFTSITEQSTRPLDPSTVERFNATREGGKRSETATGLARALQRFWELVESHQPVRNMELPVRDAAGEIRYIRVSGKVLRDEAGEFTGYRGVGSDVTDVVRNRRQADLLRDAIDMSNDATVLYDENRRIVFTNKLFHQIFDMVPPQDEIRGMTHEEILRTVAVSGALEESFTAANVDQYVQRHLDADDGREIESTERTFSNGRTYLQRYEYAGDGGLLVQFQDITERKKAQCELEAYQAELRRLASEVSLTEERERRRISAELHDGAVQNLGLMRIKLGTLRQTAAAPHDLDAVEQIRDLLDQSIREVRSLMSELSPPMLYELGLEPAVEWLAERFHTRHHLQCTVESDAEARPLSSDVEISLFQAVRELLVNIVKHAEATRVAIDIHRLDDTLRIQVHDDGVGFDPDQVGTHPSDTGGFGLFNVRERLGLLGGQMSIESDHGARVTMTVPLPTEEHHV
ncbi:MAG: hybrid sensor histidine kinase/response regulator [Gammaproteobacteria bacterium]